MTTVGFLHTERAHVAVMARLVRERAPGLVDVHVVDETLLPHLRRLRAQGVEGIDDELRRRLGVRVGELMGRAVDAVVCTCAALGDEAARLAVDAEVPVVGPGGATGVLARF